MKSITKLDLLHLAEYFTQKQMAEQVIKLLEEGLKLQISHQSLVDELRSVISRYEAFHNKLKVYIESKMSEKLKNLLKEYCFHHCEVGVPSRSLPEDNKEYTIVISYRVEEHSNAFVVFPFNYADDAFENCSVGSVNVNNEKFRIAICDAYSELI